MEERIIERLTELIELKELIELMESPKSEFLSENAQKTNYPVRIVEMDKGNGTGTDNDVMDMSRKTNKKNGKIKRRKTIEKNLKKMTIL